MAPTNKLVQDLVAMESTYINTGHPDFLSGHKAMAIINEKHQSSKPVQVDPKTGKPLPVALQKDATNPQSLDNVPGNDGGFFGSFFASKNKKKMAAMEAPPPVLKASGTLSEREQIETEVIKLLISSYFNIVKRTMIDMVPKAIMLNLVAYAKEELQRELLENLYRTTALDDLLKESEVFPSTMASSDIFSSRLIDERNVNEWSSRSLKQAKSWREFRLGRLGRVDHTDGIAAL